MLPTPCRRTVQRQVMTARAMGRQSTMMDRVTGPQRTMMAQAVPPSDRNLLPTGVPTKRGRPRHKAPH